jgi:MFS family permease
VLAVGSALPLLATAALAERPEGWRAVWALAALPLLALPWLFRRLPETHRGAGAARAHGPPPHGLRALLRGAHRAAVLRALGAIVAIQGAEAASRAWLFYHPVTQLRIAPRSATLLLLGAGAVGLVGFPLGGWLADTRGRRPALLAGASLFALGIAGFYGATPPPGGAGLCWLFVSLAALAAGGNGALATFRAHAAELLPAPVRGTFAGLLAVGGALGWSLSMSAVAVLVEPVGGVGHAVACVVLAALPAAALLLRRLPETAVRPLAPARPASARGGLWADGRS